MTQWHFYLSGILYGKFLTDDSSVLVSRLIPETAEFSEYKPFEDDSFYRELCSRSLLLIFKNLKSYQSLACAKIQNKYEINEEVFTKCKDGSFIQRIVKFPKKLLYKDHNLYAILMSGRDYCAILVKKDFEQETVLKDWFYTYKTHQWENIFSPGIIHPVVFHGTFMVPTQDGEKLASDVYLPFHDSKSKVPTVLIRTPYGKGAGKETYYRYVQRGYAVVIQDVRGREDSTGIWMPNYYEVDDGNDTLNWIAKQSWSDGNVGMTGGSYLGYVQWAAAASGNPHLKAILSSVCSGSAFIDGPRKGGSFESGMMAWAFAMTEKRFRPDLMERDDWDSVLDIRPLKDLAPKALGHSVPFLEEWLKHPHYDDFWKMCGWQERYKGGIVPALIMSGWFDDNSMGTTEALDLTKGWPKGTKKVILGPWKHSGNANYDIHDMFVGEDGLRYDLDLICMKWLDHHLKGIENNIENSPMVEYYTLGDNCWKTDSQWPCTPAEYTPYYLEASEVNIARGDMKNCGKGILSKIPSVGDTFSVYTYNPENPAIHIIDMSENEISVPEDYTNEEKRADVLSFSTKELDRPLTVTGDLYGVLYISCDCPDTDIIIRLTDVDENGRSTKLAEGLLDIKYRDGFDTPQYLDPGKVYRAVIRTTKISNTFKTGHKMRITITSGAKNFVFPNSNTIDGFDSTYMQSANICIHHSHQYPSYVYIPVERNNS